MGSGFNGQSFAFQGYLPIDSDRRSRKLREMQQRIIRERQTQIFIETPYRNNKLIAELTRELPRRYAAVCGLRHNRPRRTDHNPQSAPMGKIDIGLRQDPGDIPIV